VKTKALIAGTLAVAVVRPQVSKRWPKTHHSRPRS